MRNWLFHRPFVLSVSLCFALIAPAVVRAQTFDVESTRVPISEVDSVWHFHLGDDPRWSEPGFDDSQWPVLKPTEQWSKQGYPREAEFAWFRFRLRVPPHTGSLVLQVPSIAKSFQLFSDGQMIAQVGLLPPGPARDVMDASRVFTLPVNSGPASKEIVVAFRLWQDPSMPGTRPHRLRGSVYVGAPDAILDQFSNMKAADLLGNGSTYTTDILLLIVGGATILLFWLTRERFYLWFACYVILEASFLPIELAAEHQAWSYHIRTYFNILLDLFANISWSLFLVEAVRPGRWKFAAVPASLAILADVIVTLVLVHQIPVDWADTGYFLAVTGVHIYLGVYLVHGWRTGNLYAKLLFFPFAVDATFSILNNLRYVLQDLKLDPPFNMQPNSILLLREPFDVSLQNIGAVFTLLGLLAVLVYRFARTNREEQRLSAALKAAHDIQQRLVPANVPALGGLCTQIAYRAAEEVGGDFCQILPRPDGSIFVTIGDVSGKGLQAAMLGAVVVGAIRCMATESVAPGVALERLNTVLLDTENIGFVTCLCLVLTADGQLSVANAGHLSPYLDGEEMLLEAGLPLGIVPSISYTQTTVTLPGKARLTLLSDGVIEARSRSGELFGFNRTQEVSHLPASEIANRAYLFGQEDDITVITLDWQMEAFAPA
jgi:Stage II sporulation protein E (SpoIIE)